MRGRLHMAEGEIRMDGITRCLPRILAASRIIIVACGTSWHAGLVGEYMLETLARIPVEVRLAPLWSRRSTDALASPRVSRVDPAPSLAPPALSPGTDANRSARRPHPRWSTRPSSDTGGQSYSRTT